MTAFEESKAKANNWRETVDELLAALEQAYDTIKALHGEIAWDEYQHSPEMKCINAAIQKAERRAS